MVTTDGLMLAAAILVTLAALDGGSTLSHGPCQVFTQGLGKVVIVKIGKAASQHLGFFIAQPVVKGRVAVEYLSLGITDEHANQAGFKQQAA
jgi:hypothetical protein